MKHETNLRIAQILREHADRVEASETELTAVSINVDLDRDDPCPQIERNVVVGAPELFRSKPDAKLVH